VRKVADLNPAVNCQPSYRGRALSTDRPKHYICCTFCLIVLSRFQIWYFLFFVDAKNKFRIQHFFKSFSWF